MTEGSPGKFLMRKLSLSFEGYIEDISIKENGAIAENWVNVSSLNLYSYFCEITARGLYGCQEDFGEVRQSSDGFFFFEGCRFIFP